LPQATPPGDGPTREITVKTLAGPVESDRLAPPDIVKIDVEGAENEVLGGMREYLENGGSRVIYVELHRPTDWRPSIEDFGSTEEAFLSDLQSLGFDFTVLHERRAVVHIKASRG